MMNKSLILIGSLALLVVLNCTVSAGYTTDATMTTDASADGSASGDVAISSDDFAGAEVANVQPVSVSVEGAYYLQAYDDNVAVYHVHLADHPDWDVVYHNNYYWMFRGGQWYHTADFGHPFLAIQASYIPPDVITYHSHPLTGQVYQQFHGEPVNLHVGFAYNPSVHLDYSVKKEEYHNYYSGIKADEHATFSAPPPGVHVSVESMHARSSVPAVHVFHTPARVQRMQANGGAHGDEHAAAAHAEERAHIEEHGAVRAEEHAKIEEHAAVHAEERAHIEEHGAVRAEEHADIHAHVDEHARVDEHGHAKVEERKEVKKEIKKEIKKEVKKEEKKDEHHK